MQQLQTIWLTVPFERRIYQNSSVCCGRLKIQLKIIHQQNHSQTNIQKPPQKININLRVVLICLSWSQKVVEGSLWYDKALVEAFWWIWGIKWYECDQECASKTWIRTLLCAVICLIHLIKFHAHYIMEMQRRYNKILFFNTPLSINFKNLV